MFTLHREPVEVRKLKGGEIQSMTETETEERRFAYLDNECEGIGCPAVTAGGYERKDDLGEYVGMKGPIQYYDSIVPAEMGVPDKRGIIDEEAAKEAWIAAIWEAALKAEMEEEIFPEIRKREAREGVEIAEELGWL